MTSVVATSSYVRYLVYIVSEQVTAYERLQRIERDNKGDRATRVELAVIRAALLEMGAMARMLESMRNKTPPKA